MTREEAARVVDKELPHLFDWKREELIKKLSKEN